jgi:hypothetical protein
MNRTFLQMTAGCLSAIALMGVTAASAYADYPGYGGGAPGPADIWAQQHPGQAKRAEALRRHVRHAHAPVHRTHASGQTG